MSANSQQVGVSRDNGLGTGCDGSGDDMVIVRIGCTYKRPARYDDVLTLRTRTSRVSAAKIEHEYELLRGDELLAEGHSTLACVDRQGHVQRVPDWMRTE